MRTSFFQSPARQPAGRLFPAPGKAPVGLARARLRVPWAGAALPRGSPPSWSCTTRLPTSHSSSSRCPSWFIPAHPPAPRIPSGSRGLGAGADGYETAAGCTSSSAQHFSRSWRNNSIQNSLTWSKLGKTEPAAPGTTAIPRLEQRPPCQASSLPAAVGVYFPCGRGGFISLRQGGDRSFVPAGYLGSFWGQRGGSSRLSPRAILALGEGCQARAVPARDWPPVGNPGWLGTVAMGCALLHLGAGCWQPRPSRSIPVPGCCSRGMWRAG